MNNKMIIAMFFVCSSLYAAAQGLTIQSGATFKITGNISVVIENGNFLNNGNGDLSQSDIYFKGTTSGTFGGTTTLSVQNLYINKTIGNVLLGNNVAVANQVILQSGLLDLNGKNITLAATGLLTGETEATHIISPLGGTISITKNLNAPLAEDPGNLGAIFTSDADFGTVTVTRSNQQIMSGSGKTIFRYYDITPANNSGLATIFRMKYLDAELDGIDENGLRFFKSINNGISYTDEGFNSRNTTSNFVSLSNVNSFARFTLTTAALTLPVILQSFNAQCVNGNTVINFKTAIEINSDKFYIQRSTNSLQWNDIISIPASGGSNGKAYNYTDPASAETINYYRLRMVDKNGSSDYSFVKKVEACEGNAAAIKLTPVPVKANAVLTVNSLIAGKLVIRIYSADGRQQLTQNKQVITGVNSIDVNLSSLSSGSYYLTVLSPDGTLQRIAFIK